MTADEVYQNIHYLAGNCPRMIAMGQWSGLPHVTGLSAVLAHSGFPKLAQATLDGSRGIGWVATISNTVNAEELALLEKQCADPANGYPWNPKPEMPFTPKPAGTPAQTTHKSRFRWRMWLGLAFLSVVPSGLVVCGVALFSYRAAVVVGVVLILGAASVWTGSELLDWQGAVDVR